MINKCYDIREEKLFLFAYILWMIDASVDITLWNDIASIQKFCNYLQSISFIILIVMFLLKRKYTQKDVIGLFLIVLIGILGFKSVSNKYIIRTIILIYFSANVDFNKILKCTFIFEILFMSITVLASQMNILENVLWIEDSIRVRQSLGYDYCGYLAHEMLFFTTSWFCIRRKMSVVEIIVAVCINYFVYIATDSRTDFYLSVLAIAGFILIKQQIRLKFVVKYGYVIFSVISLVLHMAYGFNIRFITILDQMLNNRLKLGYTAIKEVGFSLFGKSVRWIGQGGIRSNPSLVYNYVDNAFLKEIISYGWLFWFILAVMFWLLGKIINQTNDYKLSWALIIMWCYAFMNAHLCMPVFNVFILLLGKIFCTNEELEEAGRIGYFKLPAKI